MQFKRIPLVIMVGLFPNLFKTKLLETGRKPQPDFHIHYNY